MILEVMKSWRDHKTKISVDILYIQIRLIFLWLSPSSQSFG